MFNFNALNNNFTSTIKEGVDSREHGYIKLNELVGKTVKICGFYVSDKGNYGKSAVLVCEKANINLPTRYVDTLEAIRNNVEAVKAIKNGECCITNIHEISTKSGNDTVCFDFENVENVPPFDIYDLDIPTV